MSQRKPRFYDVMAQYLPAFGRSGSFFRGFRRPLIPKRGSLISLNHKIPPANPVPVEEEDQDEDQRLNYHLRTDTIFVEAVPVPEKREKVKVKVNPNFDSDPEGMDNVSVSDASVIGESESGRAEESYIETERSLGSDSDEGETPFITEGAGMMTPDSEPMFTLNDEDGFKMPKIPPLATDLIEFLATIPDSAPASLSPYTFCEEVIGLQGADFEQFLEEDTLCLKSVLYGGRFNEDTIYDFFTSLNDEQYEMALNVIFKQYFKLAKLLAFVRDCLKVNTIAELAMLIEKECVKQFGAKTAMLWVNIESAKTLINHSKFMKYPHGVGLIGTAAVERRQILAPKPMTSPIYCEEYDFPFCEDASIIIAEPIVHPQTNELYGVIMMIDKVHANGAAYMYWPQSELVLLQLFASSLWRVFEKFDREIRSTANLYRIAAKYVSNQLDFFKLLRTIETTISQLMNCEGVNIYFIEGRTVFWFEVTGARISKSACSISKAGIAGYAFEHNVFVHCTCACDHPSFSSSMDGKYSSRSVLAIPLLYENVVFCVIVCRAKRGLPCFLSEDVHNLSFVAAGAAPALQMAMWYKKKLNELRTATRAQDRLGALLQTAETLSRETNIDNLVSTILINACQLLEADRASLFVIDESRTHLISKVAHGTEKPLLLPIGNGIAGHVASTGETVNIPDVYEDPRFNSSVDKSTGYRTKSLMTIPVRDQNGQIIAVAQLMNKLNGDVFTDSDVELMKAMCVFVGIALANATVIESSLTSKNRVGALLSTSLLLMSPESFSSVVHHIMSVSRDLVQADRCGLFMMSSDKGRMQSAVLAGEENQIIVKRGRGIVGYVASHNVVLNIEDAYKDKRFHSGVDQATGYRTRSILAAPIVDLRNKVSGVIEMINKDPLYNGGIFTKEDERLTTAFASFVGIAFDRKSGQRAEPTEGQTLAILLNNMVSAEESNSCEPPHQIVLSNEKLQQYQSNRFDVSQLKTLDGFKFVISCFFDLGLSKAFNINNAKLIRFLLSVHDLHHPGLRSWNRVVEKVQFLYYIMKCTQLSTILSKLECLALLVATICKDIGYEDRYQSTRSDLALQVLYRNQSVMEVHDCEVTIGVICTPEQNIFDNISQDQQVSLWQLIISLICATDMVNHFDIVSNFRHLVYPQLIFNSEVQQHRLLLAQTIMKMCIITSPTRLFPINQKWARDVLMNSLKQRKGDKLNDVELARSQVAFINFIAQPILNSLTLILKGIEGASSQLNGNLEQWITLANHVEQKDE